MVITINGIPGSGKNVLATYLAKVHFKKYNTIIRKIIRKILHEELILNNVYTTYPILLKKYSKRAKKKGKQDIYSNRTTLYDLVPYNRFKEGALIIIDETQAFYDSEDHKEFPKEISIFNQFHRHFDIDNIIYITQHPSRLMKKLRILCCEYDKIKKFIVIPFINLAFLHIVKYFEYEDYGKYNHPKKEAKTYDVKNQYKVFFVKKIFKSYNSKYLNVLNKDQLLYDRGTFSSKDLSVEEIKYIYQSKI